MRHCSVLLNESSSNVLWTINSCRLQLAHENLDTPKHIIQHCALDSSSRRIKFSLRKFGGFVVVYTQQQCVKMKCVTFPGPIIQGLHLILSLFYHLLLVKLNSKIYLQQKAPHPPLFVTTLYSQQKAAHSPPGAQITSRTSSVAAEISLPLPNQNASFQST